MIDFKPPEPHPEPPVKTSPKLSLNCLWENIIRTKRLPEGYDAQTIYHSIRDRLRDPEKEVRQHALRVLHDLIQVTNLPNLDGLMRTLTPELLSNLDHNAPALRKGALDTLRTYVKLSSNHGGFLQELVQSNNAKVLSATPFLLTQEISDEVLMKILDQLWIIANGPNPLKQESVVKSLARMRHYLGEDRFRKVFGEQRMDQLEHLCDHFGLPLEYYSRTSSLTEEEEDKVILETEITLKSGPAITMKIHEESRPSSRRSSEDVGIMRVLDDSDDYQAARRTPRKVRFGGEVVKMRTPESDTSSNHREDESTTINITVINALSIKTKRSLIPIRITSLPSTPKKTFKDSKRHKSSPNLSLKTGPPSKIPLRKLDSDKEESKDLKKEGNVKKLLVPESIVGGERKGHRSRSPNPKSLSPIPIHREVELFHNLTRSPDRSRSPKEDSNGNMEMKLVEAPLSIEEEKKMEPVVNNINEEKETVKEEEKENEVNNNNKAGDLKLVEEVEEDKRKYNSFKICKENGNVGEDSWSFSVEEDKAEDNKSAVEKKPFREKFSFSSEDETWNRYEGLDNLLKALGQPGTCENLESKPASLLFEALFACQTDRFSSKVDEAFELMITNLKREVLEDCLKVLVNGLSKLGAPRGVRLSVLIVKRTPEALQTELVLNLSHKVREGILQILMSSVRILPSSQVQVKSLVGFASMALRDRRKKVRHAALELLASLATVSSSGEVLRILSDDTGNYPDHQHLLRVVRTRLSRRQLPSIESDGSVVYSTPKDQSELEWLEDRVDRFVASSSSSSSSSVNYWKEHSKLRQEGEQVKSALCPVYVLQPKDWGFYERGRSFSPPKGQRRFCSPEEVGRRSFKERSVRKSFSSEQLLGSKDGSRRSSSTSTGSSKGGWQKDLRSGIPVVMNFDSKLRFRHGQGLGGGPMIARR